jgi:hypothetical protein
MDLQPDQREIPAADALQFGGVLEVPLPRLVRPRRPVADRQRPLAPVGRLEQGAQRVDAAGKERDDGRRAEHLPVLDQDRSGRQVGIALDEGDLPPVAGGDRQRVAQRRRHHRPIPVGWVGDRDAQGQRAFPLGPMDIRVTAAGDHGVGAVDVGSETDQIGREGVDLGLMEHAAQGLQFQLQFAVGAP